MATPTSSRFNFFSSPKTPTKSRNSIQLPADLNNDELLTMDIERALFPGGQSAQDPFSPASFKNLLMNAEGTLLRLQTAYKLRTMAWHELTVEREADKEERDEADTRTQCLKNQVEDLAHQVSMRDDTIKELIQALALEQQAREAERDGREKRSNMVEETGADRKRTSGSELSIDTQLGGDDLGISGAKRRTWRSSANSTELSSSTAGESDAESAAESVFSRCQSPALTLNSLASCNISTLDVTPESKQASFSRVVSPAQKNFTPRPQPVQQRSTFQKILTTISASTTPVVEKDAYDGMGLGEVGCNNCRGKSASAAWDAVSLMRAENKGLKMRVEELEEGVSGALRDCEAWRF